MPKGIDRGRLHHRDAQGPTAQHLQPLRADLAAIEPEPETRLRPEWVRALRLLDKVTRGRGGHLQASRHGAYSRFCRLHFGIAPDFDDCPLWSFKFWSYAATSPERQSTESGVLYRLAICGLMEGQTCPAAMRRLRAAPAFGQLTTEG